MNYRSESQLKAEIADAWRLLNQYERSIDMLTAERDQARSRYDRAVLILSEIHKLLNPLHVVLPDSRVFEYQSQTAQEQLQALSDMIRAIPDKID